MLDLLLRNGHIAGRGLVDLAVDGGRIVDQGSRLTVPARREIDLGGSLLMPGFVESHVHLDIALMNFWPYPGRPEPFRSIKGLNEAVERRRLSFTCQEIELRAGLAIELASRHGVTALRAQCHVDPEIGLKHLEALLAVKERYAARVSLQIVAFPQQGLLRQRGTLDLFREAFRLGADVMGCAPNLDPQEAGGFRASIDAALNLAMELDVDLDVHADLGLPDQIELEDLEVVHLARQVIERGYTFPRASQRCCPHAPPGGNRHRDGC